MKKYLPRIADKELKLRLESFGATLIVGPKWSGKTTTAMQYSKSVLKMQDPDTLEQYKITAKIKPSFLLKGEYPRLIDEWQVEPTLWDAVRYFVDENDKPGLFILTGSKSIDHTKIMHSGIGRISRMKMYPMSLFESNESNGKISLKELFNNSNLDINGIESDLSIDNLIFAACRGGWPSSLDRGSNEAKLFVANDYLDGICKNEISTIDSIKRVETTTRMILRSYARNVSTLTKKTTILEDLANNIDISLPTLDSYLKALESLYVIEDIPCWSPKIRSKTAIRSNDKREFIDPSLAINALGLNPSYFEKDLKTFGFIFENLCARDLKVYSSSLGGALSYYHDRYGLEVDFVLHLKDGRFALIESKLGSSQIDEASRNLLKVKELLEKNNLELPSLMIVLTAGKIAYKKDDGILVIPIGCLKD